MSEFYRRFVQGAILLASGVGSMIGAMIIADRMYALEPVQRLSAPAWIPCAIILAALGFLLIVAGGLVMRGGIDA